MTPTDLAVLLKLRQSFSTQITSVLSAGWLIAGSELQEQTLAFDTSQLRQSIAWLGVQPQQLKQPHSRASSGRCQTACLLSRASLIRLIFGAARKSCSLTSIASSETGHRIK